MRHSVAAWTVTELTYLRDHAADGADAIAEHLGRTPKAVREQAARARVSLRRAGERRGILLGQPAATSWAGLRADPRAARIRTDVLAGRIDLTVIEQQLAAVATGPPQPLCPACVARPQATRSGLCRVCHLHALARAHDDADAVDRAQQALWTARQQAHRRRTSGGT